MDKLLVLLFLLYPTGILRAESETDVLKLLGISLDLPSCMLIKFGFDLGNSLCTAFAVDVCKELKKRCNKAADDIKAKINSWDNNAEILINGKKYTCVLDKPKLLAWVEDMRTKCLAFATPELCSAANVGQCQAGQAYKCLVKCRNAFADYQIGPQTCTGIPKDAITCTEVKECKAENGQPCHPTASATEFSNLCCKSGFSCTNEDGNPFVYTCK